MKKNNAASQQSRARFRLPDIEIKGFTRILAGFGALAAVSAILILMGGAGVAKGAGPAILDLDTEPAFQDYRRIEASPFEEGLPLFAPPEMPESLLHVPPQIGLPPQPLDFIESLEPLEPLGVELPEAPVGPGQIADFPDEIEIPPLEAPRFNPKALAVVDLDSETVGTPELRAIAQAIHNEFNRLGRFEVYGLRETREALQSLGYLPYDPYKAPPSESRMSESIAAEYLVSGTLDRLTDSYVLRTHIYSARHGDFANTDIRIATGGLGDLLMEIEQVVEVLAEGMPEDPPAATTPPPVIEKDPALDSISFEDPDWDGVGAAPTPRGPINGARPGAGAPLGALLAAEQEVQALISSVRRLQTDLQKQISMADQYKRDNDKLGREVTELKSRIGDMAIQPAPSPKPEPTVAPQPTVAPAPTQAPTVAPTAPATPVAPTAADRAQAANLANEAENGSLSWEQRVANLAEAMRLNPEERSYADRHADFHLNWAKDLYMRGEYNQAEQVCIQGIQAHGMDSRLRTMRGAAQMALMNYNGAEKTLRETIALNPSDANAHFNLAATIQRGDTDKTRGAEAFRAWEKYMEVAKNMPDQARNIETAKTMMEMLRPSGPETAPEAHEPAPSETSGASH